MDTVSYSPATVTTGAEGIAETLNVYAVRVSVDGQVSAVAIPDDLGTDTLMGPILAQHIAAEWVVPADLAVDNGMGGAPTTDGTDDVRVGWAHGPLDPSGVALPRYAEESAENAAGDYLLNRWGFQAPDNTVSTNGTVWFTRFNHTAGTLRPVSADDLAEILAVTGAELSPDPIDLTDAIGAVISAHLGDLLGEVGDQDVNPYADMIGLDVIGDDDVVVIDDGDDDGFEDWLDALLGGDLDRSDYDDDDDPADALPVVAATDVRVFAVDADHPNQRDDSDDDSEDDSDWL